MSHHFGDANWREAIPMPVCDAHPEYGELYLKAWELAHAHIKHIPGMPQDPYMDEAFCATQLWIWDSCFMSLFCKYARDVFPGVETLRNFYEVLHGGKRLPKIITPADEPAWVGAPVGEPYEIQVHIADNPPLFAWAEVENARMSGDAVHVRELLSSGVLQRHYAWIESLRGERDAAACCSADQLGAERDARPAAMSGVLSGVEKPDTVYAPICLRAEPCGYLWEGGRSGMDNTPRGRIGAHALEHRPNNPDMLWLDAICQQALSARSIAQLYEMIGDTAHAAEWNKKYAEKSACVESLYWDEQDGFYYDIDRRTHAFYRVPTIASYWAMTAGIAAPGRAQKLAAAVADPARFGGAVPFVSLARCDSDFSPHGYYWRGGVWLPTAYAALRGFAAYGFFREAHEAAEKLLSHMCATYTEYTPHTIWEAYSPTEHKPSTAEYEDGRIVRRDFCGWSALGPISVYIEFVLGFHTADAFSKTVKWARPRTLSGAVGVRNFRFGTVVTDIVAEGDVCTVSANEAYTLEIDGVPHAIHPGENVIHFK